MYSSDYIQYCASIASNIIIGYSQRIIHSPLYGTLGDVIITEASYSYTKKKQNRIAFSRIVGQKQQNRIALAEY